MRLTGHCLVKLFQLKVGMASLGGSVQVRRGLYNGLMKIIVGNSMPHGHRFGKKNLEGNSAPDGCRFGMKIGERNSVTDGRRFGMKILEGNSVPDGNRFGLKFLEGKYI